MNLKLTTIFIISCFVTSALSQWRYDSEEDDDECSFVLAKKTDQRISLQKCEEYKKFTYQEYYTAGSCKKLKSFHCINPRSLVSNGLACKENEFPHMTHVGYDEANGVKRYTCGGTLISENFVLTAAHCKSDKKRNPPNIVRLNSVSENSTQAIFRNIAEIIVHPDYETSKANDLALLKLSMKVNFQLGKLRPACLWTKDRLENNTAAITTGWGATDYAQSASAHLMKAKLDIVDIGKCQKAFGAQKALDEYHICAMDLTGGGRDSYNGDSGGSLQVIQSDNPCMAHVIGVVSKGTAHGRRYSIEVYVRVSKFIDWIEEKVWNV